MGLDVKNKFKSMIAPSINQVHESFSNVQELNDCKVKIREVMSLIKKELIDALESTAYLKPGIKKWEILRQESKNFLNMQNTFILQSLKKDKPKEKYKEYKRLVKELKEDIEAEIETYINGQINHIIKRRKAALYEIIKILLGTTAGALIAYYLQHHIF